MSPSNDTGYNLRQIEVRRVATALVAAAIVAFVVWLLVRGDGAEEPAGTGPVAASVEEIRELAAERSHPVYWLGQRGDRVLELTETAEGNIFIRYLPRGVEIGDRTRGFLTVGTYPVGDGFAATQNAADAEGAISGRAPGDALVVTNEERPTSVYVAYPDSSVQIEIYDPDAERAMELATSGDVQPVG